MSIEKEIHAPDARSLAVQVLLHAKPGIPLQASLDRGLRNTSLAHKDHGLCTELVYGSMRYAIRLNAMLDTVLKKRQNLPQGMQIALQVAAYALLFLDRVPHYATVDWAVKFVKKRFGLSLSKVCNATLRNVLRLEQEPHNESFYNEPSDYYSMPKWLYNKFIQDYGDVHAKLIMLRSLAKPKVSLRLNPRHKKYDFLKEYFNTQEGVESIGWTGFTFTTQQSPLMIEHISMYKWHDLGAFSWQAAGSQHVLKQCFENVSDLKFSPLWDACAGQGGKSLALLEQGLEVPLVSDINISRLNLLRDTARRLRLLCPDIICASATSNFLDNWQGNILLDVPCSGFGTLARRPEIRLYRSPDDIQDLIKIQNNILTRAFNILQKSQFIIYMTCTLNPDENDKLIANFLDSNPNASCSYEWQTPHEHPYLEGMYVAVIRKA